MGTEVKYIITIANVVFAILFFVALNAKIYAAANDLSFDQKFFARDIAYTINAMYSVGGEVKVHYVIDNDLDIEIKNGFVHVYYKKAREKYRYIQDLKYKIEYERKEHSLLISKVKNE